MSLTATIQNQSQSEKAPTVQNPHAKLQLKYQTLKNLASSLDDFSVLPYYIIFTIPALLLVSMYLGGAWFFSPLIFVFGLIPLLDMVVAPLKLNPTPEQEKILEGQIRYRICTWLWVAVQIAITIFASYVYAHFDLSLSERIGLVLSTGLIGGASINVAHELGHKTNKFEKRMAVVSLSFVSYMHFQIEHVHGHHWNVATPNDPATSRLGESFYQFFPRTVIGSYLSAWSLEKERLKKEGKQFWSLDNHMVSYTLTPIFIASCLGRLFGSLAFSFFFLQSFIGFTLLEIVNYIEHYGLQREEIAPGKYEPVRPIHSWNADERVTNYFLFKLQRHSDHHTFPVRRYQILRSFEESPQLPTGYSGCVLLALVPPLWRYVMDWRVTQWHESVKRLKEEAKAKCEN